MSGNVCKGITAVLPDTYCEKNEPMALMGEGSWKGARSPSTVTLSSLFFLFED